MDYALVEVASEQFLGQWKRLVSTTNWEKGQIIQSWRTALIEAGAPAAEYSDEAWSRRVGNVTPQHVGRLRRVYERFADTRHEYEGLYWSHFQAALDWDDAEMWLEGAVHNGWSISEMRQMRWETRGALADEEPALEASEPLDDDADSHPAEVTTGRLGVVSRPGPDDSREQDDPESPDGDQEDADEEPVARETVAADRAPAARPFAALPPLPLDVNDAFEAYKLCILRHKLAGWQEISRDAMIFSLEALVQLALAPADV